MQLVISIILGAIVGFAAGYWLWADRVIFDESARTGNGMSPLEIQAYVRKIDHLKPEDRIAAKLEPADFNFVRSNCGQTGALIGGIAGGMLCYAWAEFQGSVQRVK